MATIDQNTRAARLLDRCAALDPALPTRLALVIGVEPALLERCRAREIRLDAALEARLAAAIVRRVPPLAREARALLGQVDAAVRGTQRAASPYGVALAPSILRCGGEVLRGGSFDD